MDRNERILRHVHRDSAGVEIGPNHSPVAPKRAGFNVHVIDHVGRDELVAKYQDHGVDLDAIEEVDFVWHGEPYAELTGNRHHYDWVIASHVIEHTPDLIQFLNDCESILNDNGVLSLVIPDKRYCFDHFRPISGLGRVIDSHDSKPKRPSAGITTEYFLNVVSKRGAIAWDADTKGEYEFIHGLEEAKHHVDLVRHHGAYVDVHVWCFVPSSFRLLVHDLHALGLTQLREVAYHPTVGNEFYITLSRRGEGVMESRLALLDRIEAEHDVALGGARHARSTTSGCSWRERCVGLANRALANRNARVLSHIDQEGIGVEIGPNHSPVAPKRAGFNVHVIDHVGRDELVAKYQDHGVDLDAIEEVDFVWHGEPYAELTGNRHHYDWVIASHVIEHTPDLIQFLNDCESILNDNGVLSLVIPDKRYCFDHFRPISGLGRVIDSHDGKPKRPSAGITTEYFLDVVSKGARGAWYPAVTGKYAFIHGLDDATHHADLVHHHGAYMDVHVWCFVPSSFRLLVHDLHALGLTQLREVAYHPTVGHEFYVTLSRRGDGITESRLGLQRRIEQELSVSGGDVSTVRSTATGRGWRDRGARLVERIAGL